MEITTTTTRIRRENSKAWLYQWWEWKLLHCSCAFLL